ncbi:hypothetical protein [Deinococcus humi]|uniref:Uncharacterized protein n=1 Tax=Deinococcus humi TaxID=662880 RepID=A0A7W8JZ51_9DEIO|nr:hypothetical protein [Deinococcus humi]MBB5365483.1 hypothetical protein [Deinococcus humi]GGO37442.1 hypothetical protein GCM10008949_42680 [Deinococcus humi]
MADSNFKSNLTEREVARERLKESLDVLAERANLQVQMQKEPVKMLGGASAVGAVLGLLIGTQFKRTKKVYVDAGSPVKYQKELVKAQKSQKGGGNVGGALLATLGTLAIRTLSDRVLAPKLEEMANNLLEKAGEEPKSKTAPSGAKDRSSAGPSLGKSSAPTAMSGSGPKPMGTASTNASATASFLKPMPTGQAESYNDQASAVGSAPPIAASHEHPGVVPTPKSVVEAKAQGSVIAPDEKNNPNLR